MGCARKGQMPGPQRALGVCAVVLMLPQGGLLAQTAPAGEIKEPAQEQAQAPGRASVVSSIVTLDRERLFSESLMGRAFQARFEAETTALVAENRKLEAALEQEERGLTERRRALDADAFRPLAEEFDGRVEALRRAQDAKSRALNTSREVDQQRFFEAAVPVLGQLMIDLEAVAIVDRSAIVLSFDQIDITDQAIARLDATLGEGTVAMDAPDLVPDQAPDQAPDPGPNPNPNVSPNLGAEPQAAP